MRSSTRARASTASRGGRTQRETWVDAREMTSRTIGARELSCSTPSTRTSASVERTCTATRGSPTASTSIPQRSPGRFIVQAAIDSRHRRHARSLPALLPRAWAAWEASARAAQAVSVHPWLRLSLRCRDAPSPPARWRPVLPAADRRPDGGQRPAPGRSRQPHRTAMR